MEASFKALTEGSLLKGLSNNTVRTETVSASILGRAGPIIFTTLILEFKAFGPIPAICPAKKKSRACSAIQSVSFQRIMTKNTSRSTKHYGPDLRCL